MEDISEEILEYELIDITFEAGYELPERSESWRVCEDFPIQESTPKVEYDADGIPMGNTPEEIEQRRHIVHTYIQNWRAAHKDNPRVYNDNLKEYIKGGF